MVLVNSLIWTKIPVDRYLEAEMILICKIYY